MRCKFLALLPRLLTKAAQAQSRFVSETAKTLFQTFLSARLFTPWMRLIMPRLTTPIGLSVVTVSCWCHAIGHLWWKSLVAAAALQSTYEVLESTHGLVDWKSGAVDTRDPAILHLNLVTTADQDALLRLLNHPQVRFVHFAPSLWHLLSLWRHTSAR